MTMNHRPLLQGRGLMLSAVTLFLMMVLVLDCIPSVHSAGQILNPAYAPAQRKRLIKTFYERKDAECREKCGNVAIESSDCLGNCISPECYQSAYTNYELEEGEIDMRFGTFRDCVVEKAQAAWRTERDGANEE
eukprot:TRINITY_DN4241_c0_g1_i1.p1 TRINITY_DN4241_c0_g1~~TRINITY_DN4241_c0_g1_i1.p1  ORF type:complete len:134 (-),score=21.76 TRINITY_DN4241_c0_g1_i1:229-630(-)